MAIYNLYSTRRADLERQGLSDVYQYDDIPTPVRNQISQIARDALGITGERGDGPYGLFQNPKWEAIYRRFCREKGYNDLGSGPYYGERVLDHMEDCYTDEWIDLLELICVEIHSVVSNKNSGFRNAWKTAIEIEDAIEEVNYRLRRGGVGFQYEHPYIIRVDSQYIHAEIVKPALSLLAMAGFEGPQEEFVAAHKHYRAGEHRQAVAMAANALESAFKAIYEKKGWVYNKGARISDLVKVGRENGLWPDYLDKSFEQLVATLQSGLPKIRDNDASHGQGAELREVPGYVAAYALHLAASKIVFIVEAARG